MSDGPPPTARARAVAGHGRLLPLSLGAPGIVYGDIGTSPLYAIKECFLVEHGKVAAHALAVTHDNVLGILSLVFWALTMVVAFEYLTFVTRADNRGEGGMCSAGGRRCSPSWRGTRCQPPATSACRPTGWWSWACRWTSSPERRVRCAGRRPPR